MATPTHLDPAHLQKLVEEVVTNRNRVLALPNSFVDRCMGAGIGDLGFHSRAADAFNYGAGVAGGAGGAGGAHTHGFSNAQTCTVDRWSETHLYDMLASRMGWDADKRCPFKRVVPCRVTEKVVVFVVAGDDALVLSDEALMYPSDALITQIRLLAEAL